MTLHTTYRLLREADACKTRYTIFRKAATSRGYTGDNTPIPLTVALETNGLHDTLWALRAVLSNEKALRNKLAILFACDCAERTLPIFEARYPDDKRPREALVVVRRYTRGEATQKELHDVAAYTTYSAYATAVVVTIPIYAAYATHAIDAARVVHAANAISYAVYAAVTSAADVFSHAVYSTAIDAAYATHAIDAEQAWQSARLLEYLEERVA